jgi:microcystin-dependent protein
MIYTENSGPSLRLFMAVGASGPDLDISTLFSDRPGTLRYTAEVRLGAGWLWADGSAVPRVTYADLFNAICPLFTGTVTNANVTITAVSEDLRLLGLVGAKIEGAGIGAGVTITAVTVNTLTLSSAIAGGTFAATPLRLFPHGNGNGSTTFNLPNCKGRAIIGRSNMGDGLDNGLITVAGSGMDGTKLANAGGGQTIVLTVPNLPAHTHPISLSGSATVTTAPDHNHAFSGGTTDVQGVNIPSYNAIGNRVLAFTGGSGPYVDTFSPATVAGSHAHNIVGASIGAAGAHSHVVTLTLGATSSSPAGAAATPIAAVQPSVVENVVIKT